MRRRHTFQPQFIPNNNRPVPNVAKFISSVTGATGSVEGLGQFEFPTLTVSLLWVGLGLAAALALYSEFK